MSDGFEDLAGFAFDTLGDPKVALVESYAMVATYLNAVVARKGPIVIPAAAYDRAGQLVTLMETVRSGGDVVGQRLTTLPRDEVPRREPMAETRRRLDEAWERHYPRLRDAGA